MIYILQSTCMYLTIHDFMKFMKQEAVIIDKILKISAKVYFILKPL